MTSSNEPKVRYALVGAGNIAQVAVLPAFEHARENSELAAIVSSDAEKRRALSQRYGVALTGDYDELEDVLERGDIDAVYISTPNDSHRHFCERAARAGVHVLCEKPMAETVEDCERMIAACEDAGVQLMLAYRLHFEEANLRAVEIVKDGVLGDVKLFTSCFSQQVRPDDVRTRGELAGGALYDMGVYAINAARYLFRDEPSQVWATSTPGDDRFEGVDATTTAILRFPGGRVAQFTASLALASVSSYRVVGTKGDLLVEPAYSYVEELRHILTVEGKRSERKFYRRDQFAPELITFSRCILEGEEPEPSGEEGLADIRVIRALFESAESGRSVELPAFERRRRPSLSQEMHLPPVEKPNVVNAPAPRADR
jgi:predicted dehydrogenase